MSKLTDSEWKILKLLWKNGPMTLMEMTHALEERTGWKRTTILTFLKRMIAKDAVYFIENGRTKVFYPKVTQPEESMKETRSFLDKVYGGSIGLMLSNMIKQEAISEDELDELTEILMNSKQ